MPEAHSRCCRNIHTIKKGTCLRLREQALSTYSDLGDQIYRTKGAYYIPKSSECVHAHKAQAQSRLCMVLSPYLSLTAIEAGAGVGAGVAAGAGTATGGTSSDTCWPLTFSWAARPEKMPDTLKLISEGGMDRGQV